jgi:hypothetical protein
MPAMAMSPPPDNIATVNRLTILAPEPIKQQLESRITLHAGDRITQATLNDLTTAIN